MLLGRSLFRKVLATALAAVAFFLIYQATVIDSRVGSGRLAISQARLPFVATAYCRGETTASGVNVQAGIAAADPKFLPEGSVIQVDGLPERHQGIYTVLDTGPKIQGRHLDIYMWSCTDAVAFGKRAVTLTVLRRGWKPNQTAE
jgi:3D (Asp-Asp-Asp) domain-containing protein